MCPSPLTGGSKPHTAAKAETTGYAPASRRAVDSPPKCRWRSAVGCPVPRRRALATRSRQWSFRRPSTHNMYQNGGQVNPGGASPKTLTDGLSRSSHPFRKACGKNSVIPTEAQRRGGTLCFHGTAHRVGRTLLSAALDSADLSRAQPSRQNPAAPIINALHSHNPLSS